MDTQTLQQISFGIDVLLIFPSVWLGWRNLQIWKKTRDNWLESKVFLDDCKVHLSEVAKARKESDDILARARNLRLI